MFLKYMILVGLCVLSDTDETLDSVFGRVKALSPDVQAVRAKYMQIGQSSLGSSFHKCELVYGIESKVLKIEFVDIEFDEVLLTYVTDGKRYLEYDKDLEQVMKNPISIVPGVEALFLGITRDQERIREQFDVALLSASEINQLLLYDEMTIEDGIAIKLTAKEGLESEILKSITLLLRQIDLLPIFMHIEFLGDEEGETSIYMFEIQLESESPIGVEQIYVPEGTTIVVDEEKIQEAGSGGKFVNLADEE